jgi:decaprenylphospho-beta-D-erythro-pentofuranosid-2-ulose 2-reductase
VIRGGLRVGRKVAFVGATRGLGRALARRLAERGDALFLLGRDEAELALSALDLEARGAPAPVGHAPLDLARPAGFTEALDAADRALSRIDALVVTGGLFARHEELVQDPARLAALLDVNFTGTILLCQQAAERLAARGGGSICAFSSVAGDRARRGNYLYGATKAGLSVFLDGLELAYRDRGVRVLCVKPGFVKTAMTAGLPVPPFAGDVARAMDAGRPLVYTPAIWRWVMLVIRALPRAILRRARF